MLSQILLPQKLNVGDKNSTTAMHGETEMMLLKAPLFCTLSHHNMALVHSKHFFFKVTTLHLNWGMLLFITVACGSAVSTAHRYKIKYLLP